MVKQLFVLSISLGLVAALASCSGSGNGEGDGTDSTNTEQVVDKLTPPEVDVNKPVPVQDLFESYFAWKGKEVTITGYPDFFFDEGAIDSLVDILPAAGNKAKIVNCIMKQKYPENFAKTTPVTIKGKIKEEFFDKIILENCELVSKGTATANKGYIDPFNYKGEPISSQDFYDSYFGWKDKEITVIGYYQMTTTSTTSYGTTVRVDLGTDAMGVKMVGCNMKGAVPEDIANNREGVKIRGKVKEAVFDAVSLEECEIVK